MDFVCYCGTTFTLSTSLPRYYQLYLVARDTALNALKTKTQTDVPIPGQENALSLRLSDSNGGISSGGTMVSRVPPSTALVEPTIGRLLEEKMIKLLWRVWINEEKCTCERI